MRENFRRLRARQIDKIVKPVRELKLRRPPKGWIRAFREAMGVSSGELARRFQANRSLALQQEKAEIDDRITLRSLRACADALDCDLVYAFVPRGGTIDETVATRERTAAANLVKRVEHSMAIEDQASGDLDGAIEAQTRRASRGADSSKTRR